MTPEFADELAFVSPDCACFCICKSVPVPSVPKKKPNKPVPAFTLKLGVRTLDTRLGSPGQRGRGSYSSVPELASDTISQPELGGVSTLSGESPKSRRP